MKIVFKLIQNKQPIETFKYIILNFHLLILCLIRKQYNF